MCDTWALDVATDAPFVSSFTLQHAADGSVILLHMPERNFRAHTLVALRTILEGLQEDSVAEW
ncbi:hypothetical protein T484DRAFT_1863793 [Baffinella frigidus]|nr:hypothetical protein T484DRAFT_1863793 [Cryptophyta sp. CCMP2293]